MPAIQAVDFRIRDLDAHGYLGLTTNDRVLIDDDGAGYGWIVDTPSGCDNISAAKDCLHSSRIDLLTVAMHELGHVLGLVDLDPASYPEDLMTATLGPGVRRQDSVEAAGLIQDGPQVDKYFTQLELISTPTALDTESRSVCASDANGNMNADSLKATDSWLRTALNRPARRSSAPVMNWISAQLSARVDESTVDHLFAQLDALQAPLDARLKTSG